MAYQFKIGDRVVSAKSCTGAENGQIYTVKKGTNDQKDELVIGSREDGSGCICYESWDLVEEKTLQNNNKTNFMQTLKGMMKRLLDSETQTLYKAGLLNGDLQLTDAGKLALLELQFVEKKAELVKMAEEMLKEEEQK